MYADFFGLRELPFNNTPDPRFFFSTPDHEEALASLIYAVQQRKGFVLLTGEIGAGKTLVSRMMLRHLGHAVEFATINHAVESAADLLEAVCTEFELQFEPGASNTQLVRLLHDFLLDKFARNVPVVLVLDEAQNLPVAAFEQLRMIGNLESDDAKLLQICIVGQPELQGIIHSPQVRQLKQRIFRNFHLPALTREATECYIRHRLTVAGATEGTLFTPEAIERVFGYSRGLPRLINAVCDNAMLSAYSAGKTSVDAPIIESVLSQMMFTDPAGDPRHSHGRGGYDRHARHHHHSDTAVARTHPETSGAPAHSQAHVRGDAHPASGSFDERLAERMLARLEGLGDRLIQVEREMIRLQTHVKPGESHHGRWQDSTVEVEALLRRVHSESETLHRRENKLCELTEAVKSTAGELTRLLARLQRAAEVARANEDRARVAHGELADQTDRAARVLESLTRARESSSRRAAADHASTRILANSAKSASFMSGKPDRQIAPLLDDARSCIDDLRFLTRSSETGRVQSGFGFHNRLADQAEGLLAMVASPPKPER